MKTLSAETLQLVSIFESDKFHNKETILNSEVSCLKRCY